VVTRLLAVAAFAACFAGNAEVPLSSFDEAQCKRLVSLTRQLLRLMPSSNDASPAVLDLRRRIEPIRTDLSIAHDEQSPEEICPGLVDLQPPPTETTPPASAA
jgi:hypothetical protein